MPAQQIGSGVSLRGIYSDDFTSTWNLSGTLTAASVSWPMAIDNTANATVKPAGDGDGIVGQLASYENRVQEGIVVGALREKGNFTFDYTGTAPTRGLSVVGSATPGKVKAASIAAAQAVNCPNMVVEVDTVGLTVTVKFG